MSYNATFINELKKALNGLRTIHSVGEEWCSYIGKIPVGGVPYCGQEVTRSTYSALWQYAQNQGLVKSESEWQSIYSAQGGNVPFYSSGDGSSTFRMPRLVGYVRGASGQLEAGTYVKEGLPNIEGSFRPQADVAAFRENGVVSGAFVKSSISVSGYGAGYSSIGSSPQNLEFDASSSNPIYGNSDHVTPETSTVLFGVYAFGEVSNVDALDAGTLASAVARVESNLNTKVDKTSAHIIETWSDGASWYRKYSDGWVEQGGVAKGMSGTITLFVTMVNTNYSIVANVKNGNDNSSGFTFQPRTPTTTSIPYYCTYVHPNHSGGSSEQYSWEVKGYSA